MLYDSMGGGGGGYFMIVRMVWGGGPQGVSSLHLVSNFSLEGF